jgi:hypothetical protein
MLGLPVVQDMATYQKNKMQWTTKDHHSEGRETAVERVPFDPEDAALTVTLSPMEVRTFLIKV